MDSSGGIDLKSSQEVTDGCNTGASITPVDTACKESYCRLQLAMKQFLLTGLLPFLFRSSVRNMYLIKTYNKQRCLYVAVSIFEKSRLNTIYFSQNNQPPKY